MFKDEIKQLIKQSPLEIDTDIQLSGRPPTMANSEFLTNKEQGDWAEEIVFKAINEFSEDFFAVKYGRDDSIAAGDDGFSEFYKEYQEELNAIGKRPDLLIFKIEDFPQKEVDIEDDDQVMKAIAAIEVRSSSFLVGKYTEFMNKRQKNAINACIEIRDQIIKTELGELLKKKNKVIYNLISKATKDTFKELDFRRPSWSLTPQLRQLMNCLNN